MRLIDADALKKEIAKRTPHFAQRIEFTPCFDAIRNAPAVDAVPVKSIEQLKWERDTAIRQLEEHGIPFCGKADVVAVVRCKECKHKPKYDGPNRVVFPDEVCPCQCYDDYYNWMPSDDWYCADGERSEKWQSKK